jgi:hypothetical protein
MDENIELLERGITKDRLAVIVSGLALLIPASLGLLASRVPTILSPLPAVTVLPGFVLSPLYPAAVMVPPLLFFVWNPGLFRSEGRLPKRSGWLLVAAIVLTVIWFSIGWKDGLHYQGATYVFTVALANVGWIGTLIVMLATCRRHDSSFKTNLAFHWILFAWIAWYAFPYLGELP